MQDKTVKVGGYLDAEIDGNKLIFTGGNGLVSVATVDLSGTKLYFCHPLTGWYVEVEMSREPESDNAGDS